MLAKVKKKKKVLPDVCQVQCKYEGKVNKIR